MPATYRCSCARPAAALTRTLRGSSPLGLPGCHSVELDTLRRIAAKPSVGVSLSEYLRLSPARICRILARLEGAGLVARAETHLDGRVRRAEATDEGLEFLRSVNEDLGSMAALWLDGLRRRAPTAHSCRSSPCWPTSPESDAQVTIRTLSQPAPSWGTSSGRRDRNGPVTPATATAGGQGHRHPV